MNTVLSQRKYQIGLRWAAEAGRTFGLWVLIATAVLYLVQLALRPSTPYEEYFSFLILRYLPFVLTAIGWVHLVRSFPTAIASGMTRKEFLAAFTVFSAIVIAAGLAFTLLIRLVHNLIFTDGTDGLDLYGSALLEILIRLSLFFTAGAAAGAIIARFNARSLSAVLVGLLVSVLIFRQIPFQLMLSEFSSGGTLTMEFPGSEELLAPIDAVLTLVFVLVTWLALARAPLPHKKA